MTKQKKTRLWAFSFYDWLFITGALILMAGLFVVPFLNPNNQALIQLLQKKHDKAEQKWRKLLSQYPFSHTYRMNLALNYQAGGQTDKALQEYQITRNLIHKTKTENIKKEDKKRHLFFSFFNSATAQNEDMEQAFHFYQEALAFQPDSRPIKTNIELLTQNQTHKKKKGKKQKKPGDKEQKEKQGQEQKPGDKEQKQGPDKKENTDKGKKTGQDMKDQQEKESNQKSGNTKENHKKSASPNPMELKKPEPDKERNFAPQGLSPKLAPDQTEAILKAISEQEKQIKKRRSHSRKKPSRREKDW